MGRTVSDSAFLRYLTMYPNPGPFCSIGSIDFHVITRLLGFVPPNWNARKKLILVGGGWGCGSVGVRGGKLCCGAGFGYRGVGYS